MVTHEVRGGLVEENLARATEGDLEAMADVLRALLFPHRIPPESRATAAAVTPEALWTWLDAAEARRPSSGQDERMFTRSLTCIADYFVPLSITTERPWYKLHTHPVFAPKVSPAGLSRGLPEDAIKAAAFAVTVGLVPFLQAIATEAAQRTFSARAKIWRRLRSGNARISGPNLVIEERNGRMEFRVPSDIPDAALEALVALGDQGLETLGEPDPKGRAVTVTWNAESGKWERIISRN
jgi:hypothetical protein